VRRQRTGMTRRLPVAAALAAVILAPGLAPAPGPLSASAVGRPAARSAAPVAALPVRGGAGAPWSPLAAPCGIHAQRKVDPLVVSEGRSVPVGVDFGFDCPTGQRKVNLYLLVNGPAVASGEPSLVTLNAALNAALRGYLARIGRASGSRGAYGVFGDTFNAQWGLKSFADWPADLGAWVTPAIDTHGLMTALVRAAADLPRDPGADGASNVVVAILGSSRPIGSTEEIQAACSALAAADARLVLIALESLRGSGGLHDLTCIGTFLRATDAAGADLDDVFDELAATTIDEARVQSIEVFDGLSEPFSYVNGSGDPRDPTTVLGNDLTWTFEAPVSGEHALGYRVEPAVGWTDVRRRLSREAYVRFVFADMTEASVPLYNPTMCIHAYRHPAFCASLPAFLPMTLRRHGRE
jgi:hypothetical protein